MMNGHEPSEPPQTMRILEHFAQDDPDIELLYALDAAVKWHKKSKGTRQGLFAAVSWFNSKFGPNDNILDED